MKKRIVYMLLPALLLSLCACGAANKPSATHSPNPTSTPVTATPDVNDGIVKDDDGIITDDDTGVVPTQTPGADASAKPSASAAAGKDEKK